MRQALVCAILHSIVSDRLTSPCHMIRTTMYDERRKRKLMSKMKCVCQKFTVDSSVVTMFAICHQLHRQGYLPFAIFWGEA